MTTLRPLFQLTLSPIELVAALLLTPDDKEEATAILFPPELPAPKTEEEEAEAMILAAMAVLFALLEPCFCCLSENALLLSLEKRRLLRSGLMLPAAAEPDCVDAPGPLLVFVPPLSRSCKKMVACSGINHDIWYKRASA